MKLTPYQRSASLILLLCTLTHPLGSNILESLKHSVGGWGVADELPPNISLTLAPMSVSGGGADCTFWCFCLMSLPEKELADKDSVT